MSGYQEQPMSENARILNADPLTGTSLNVKKLNTGIYQIVNIINGKRYIGSSINLAEREKQHFRMLNNGNHPNCFLQKTYNKYGEENLKFRVLLYCAENDLIFFEQRVIDSYDFIELYNLRKIADSNRGFVWNNESRMRASIAQKNKKYITSDETKKKISQALKGKKKTPEHIKKVADAIRGRELTPENLKNIRESAQKRKGKPIHTEEFKNKIRIIHTGINNFNFGKKGEECPFSKSVYQIDKNTNEIIKKWGSIKQAGCNLKITPSHISEICNGSKIRKTAGGFKWEFANKQEEL